MEKKDFISKREVLNQIIEENKKKLEKMEEEYAKELFYKNSDKDEEETEENLKSWGYDFYYMLSYSIMKEEEEACISIRMGDGISSQFFGAYKKEEFFNNVYLLLKRFYNFLEFYKK